MYIKIFILLLLLKITISKYIDENSNKHLTKVEYIIRLENFINKCENNITKICYKELNNLELEKFYFNFDNTNHLDHNINIKKIKIFNIYKNYIKSKNDLIEKFDRFIIDIIINYNFDLYSSNYINESSKEFIKELIKYILLNNNNKNILNQISVLLLNNIKNNINNYTNNNIIKNLIINQNYNISFHQIINNDINLYIIFDNFENNNNYIFNKTKNLIDIFIKKIYLSENIIQNIKNFNKFDIIIINNKSLQSLNINNKKNIIKNIIIDNIDNIDNINNILFDNIFKILFSDFNIFSNMDILSIIKINTYKDFINDKCIFIDDKKSLNKKYFYSNYLDFLFINNKNKYINILQNINSTNFIIKNLNLNKNHNFKNWLNGNHLKCDITKNYSFFDNNIKKNNICNNEILCFIKNVYINYIKNHIILWSLIIFIIVIIVIIIIILVSIYIIKNKKQKYNLLKNKNKFYSINKNDIEILDKNYEIHHYGIYDKKNKKYIIKNQNYFIFKNLNFNIDYNLDISKIFIYDNKYFEIFQYDMKENYISFGKLNKKYQIDRKNFIIKKYNKDFIYLPKFQKMYLNKNYKIKNKNLCHINNKIIIINLFDNIING